MDGKKILPLFVAFLVIDALFVFLWVSYQKNPNDKLQSPLQKPLTVYSDLDEARKIAKKEKKPIFVDLYASWCEPCKKLDRETFKHPSIRTLLQRFVFVKVDTEKGKGRQLLRGFRVQNYPTTLMLDHNGNEIERVVGFYRARFFLPAVQAALTTKEAFASLQKKYKTNAYDWGNTLQWAHRALLRKELIQAREAYSLIAKELTHNLNDYKAQALFGLARSYTRVGKYQEAVPFLEKLRGSYASSPTWMDAIRLELLSYRKLRENKKWFVLHARFRKQFPKTNPEF